jgi:hypothetical protein
MTETTVTFGDVVNAASDALRDLETGALTPAEVGRRAVNACRELCGIVAGPTDPLWPLHGDVCRQYLAAGGLSAVELREWAAVQERREAGDLAADDPPPPL